MTTPPPNKCYLDTRLDCYIIFFCNCFIIKALIEFITRALSWIITPTQNDLSKPDLLLRSRCHLQWDIIVANWKLGFRTDIEFPWITPVQWISYENCHWPSYKSCFYKYFERFFSPKIYYYLIKECVVWRLQVFVTLLYDHSPVCHSSFGQAFY